MGRKELCRFNELTTDGRIISSEGTTWKDPLPLFDIDRTIIGTVSNVTVEGNRLYGDIEFELDEVFSLTVDMRGAHVTPTAIDGEDVLLISGEVLSASVSPDNAYPWRD